MSASHNEYGTSPRLVVLLTCIQALYRQPLAFYFAVTYSFQLYSGGVYQPTDCGSTAVNHAMVMVSLSAIRHMLLSTAAAALRRAQCLNNMHAGSIVTAIIL